MPLASEKAKESGGGSTVPITRPGVHLLRVAWVSEQKTIGSGDHSGRPFYSVCWEDENGEGAVWDNLLAIDSAWSRLAQLYLGLGEEDRNFDSVDELVNELLRLFETNATVYAECKMGKASAGYPAKIEIGWYYNREEGATKIELVDTDAVASDEVPF